MSLTSDIQQALNEQINLEFASAYTYLSMLAYFESRALGGFAHWMRLQYDEENVHAMKLFNFLVDRGIAPELPAIGKPAHEFDGPVSVFEAALAHDTAAGWATRLTAAGVPAGLVNFVPGSGSEIGDLMTDDPRVRFITFNLLLPGDMTVDASHAVRRPAPRASRPFE